MEKKFTCKFIDCTLSKDRSCNKEKKECLECKDNFCKNCIRNKECIMVT